MLLLEEVKWHLMEPLMVPHRFSDAILGLRELLETHSQLIPAHLTTLINGCVRLIGDEASHLQIYGSILT